MALISKLYIQTALYNERTHLKRSSCTPPFKIADVTEDRSCNGLSLMLMSSSPGVLDGDAYHLEIDVAEKSSLDLQTQSYQRLFHMKRGASQSMDVHLKKESSFTYLPHPIVPHEGAVFSSKNKLYIEENCLLIWGEVISCGRKLNGEVFKFSAYHSVTEILVNGRLVVKENLLLKPAEMNLAAIGQLEGYSHQASLIYINEKVEMADVINLLVQVLNEEIDISFGVSALPVNGLVLRLLGNKAEQLFQLLKRMAALLQILKQKVKNKKEGYVV